MQTLQFQSLPVAAIAESPFNPRKHMRPEQLEELIQSVCSKGVVVPVLVRPGKGKQPWELVYGHRRLLAAKRAGLEVIPATIRELSDAEVLEVALLENVARDDMHPLEEGAAYKQLLALGAIGVLP